MRKIDSEEIQPLLLGILKAFKSFALENEFEFLLCGGTTLGAVRHQGFIPWDDDIDVYISRATRERIIKYAEKNEYIDAEKRYKILVPCEFPNAYPFIKIIDTQTVIFEKNFNHKYAIGLYIDVFCLSYWPDSVKETKKILRKNHFYRRMNQTVISGNYRNGKLRMIGFISKPLKAILMIMGMDSSFWCKKMLLLDDCPKGEYVGNVTWPDGFHDRYKASWFLEKKEILFEDEYFFIPAEYDKILTAFYGDYMQLPPEEKRVKHDPDAYYRE